MGKLIKMKVLIVGMRGLGVETAKNLILAGPQSVDIYDPTMTSINDLGSNFNLRESDVEKRSRAEASLGQLRELNPYVKVSVVEKLDDADYLNYHVVCLTENFLSQEKNFALNEACRAKGVGFILAETLGAAGYIFLDYGDNHKITDLDGEPCKQFIVSSITQDEQGLVTVHEDKRHSFQSGDYVKFREVEGMAELNDEEPLEIVYNGPHSFKIKKDTKGFGAYTRQGVVENVKVPTLSKFNSMQQVFENPGYLENPSMKFSGMQRSEQIHIAIRAIHRFRDHEGRFPRDELEDKDKISVLAKKINEEGKKAEALFVEELDEELVRSIAAYSACSITS